MLVAPEDPEALVAAMAQPDVRIVSLTITEKGYCLDAASGTLDLSHPDIVADLANPSRPRSALGLLAAAIARRRAEALPPFTILSCDNLAANGHTLHRVLTEFARRLDPALGSFVENEVACPSTMVDRIVPATTGADRDRVAAALGMDDAWPVIAEPFLQWVIEDRFPQGRPEWEAFGATMASDVAPFEAMKLRLLNAAHSALAYAGLARGHETVAEAVADPALASFARALMHDAAETLSLPPGTDVAAYQTALMDRFANSALRHRLAQIAMDGSQKLPPRLLATMRDRLEKGLPAAHHAAAVAAWMRHVENAVALQDPLADELRSAVRRRADRPHCSTFSPSSPNPAPHCATRSWPLRQPNRRPASWRPRCRQAGPRAGLAGGICGRVGRIRGIVGVVRFRRPGRVAGDRDDVAPMRPGELVIRIGRAVIGLEVSTPTRVHADIPGREGEAATARRRVAHTS